MAFEYQSMFMTASEHFTPEDVEAVIELHHVAMKHMQYGQYGKHNRGVRAWAAGVMRNYSEVHAFLNAMENGTPWPPVAIEVTADAD